MNWNQLSYVLFEDKEYMAVNLNEVNQCATHPIFPIIFAGQKCTLYYLTLKSEHLNCLF